jgi:DNA-binding transcriptional LysR family regulator
MVADAFRENRLDLPRIYLRTLSVHLRATMVTTGRFVTTFPRSVLLVQAERPGLKALPVKLAPQSWPILAVTLKTRTLSPVVSRFLDHAREAARGLSKLNAQRRGRLIHC